MPVSSLPDDNPRLPRTMLRPVIIILISLGCLCVYLWQISSAKPLYLLFHSLGAIPGYILGDRHIPGTLQAIPAWLSIFTSMFVHQSWPHLVGNLLYLWLFGNHIEDAMGHVRFLVFYLLCGVIAFFTHALGDVNSLHPVIGASGAISGVLGAYLILYPHSRVLLRLPNGYVIALRWFPVSVLLLLWLALQILFSVIPGREWLDNAAWGAHIGGFIAGMLLVPIFKKKHVALFSRNKYSP